VDIRQCSP